MVGPGVPIAIALLGGRRCPARCRGHSLGSAAPAASDRLAPKRYATPHGAWQRPQLDAEIVYGENVSFQSLRAVCDQIGTATNRLVPFLRLRKWQKALSRRRPRYQS